MTALMKRQGPAVASAPMSSLAPAPVDAGPADAVPCDRAPAGRLRPSSGAVLALLVAASLTALAMVTAGGVDNTVATTGNTWSEIAVTLLGATAVCALLIAGPRDRRWGLVTVCLMAALTALEALSITWSFLPDSSWLASSQAVSYLAAFTAGVCLARLTPDRWPALLGGFAVAMAVLCGWSLLAKVFPATLASANVSGRLQAPFGYWNAIGLCAALGLPACLWASAHKDRRPLMACLTAPAMCLMLSVDVLSYSRSADAAAVVGVGIWLIFVPLRLRSIGLLAVSAVGAAMISAWMLSHAALKDNNVVISAQDHAGHTFGIVVAAVLIVVAVASFYIARSMDRTSLEPTFRRRIGWVLIALLVVVVLAGIAGLAASSRGLTGQVSHAWNELTASSSHVSASAAGRVFEFGSSRPVYWHQAIHVGEHALLKGVGELGFADARLRYTASPDVVAEAHSYVFETFADLGLLGVALTFALLVSWLVAAIRPLALTTRWRDLSRAAASEREGMFALMAIVVSFGVQSTLDWTWFFAGVAVPVLLCAGWLAGRGPLLDQRDVPATAQGSLLDRLALRPVAAAGVVVIVAAALFIGWMQWRPLHSVEQLNTSEAATGSTHAFSAARGAVASDPLSIEPRLRLANLYEAVGDAGKARSELVHARNMQPEDALPWLWLGQFDLAHGRVRSALPEFARSLGLDQSADVTNGAASLGIAEAERKLKLAASAPGR